MSSKATIEITVTDDGYVQIAVEGSGDALEIAEALFSEEEEDDGMLPV